MEEIYLNGFNISIRLQVNKYNTSNDSGIKCRGQEGKGEGQKSV